jgi:hypothetical protein
MAMGLSYDRRVPEDLLKALAPGGFAHSLVEFGGSGMWALDLQLRGLGEAKKQYRAALYVGTTKVLDLHLKGHSFALSAHPTFASPANGWDIAWAQRHDDSWFADRWAEVDNYLQVVIEKIVQQGTYVKEGMVQAAIGRFPSTDFTVIDREAIVSFGSQPEKDACKHELAARWLDALHRADPPAWWKTRPTRLGDECDALAVSGAARSSPLKSSPTQLPTRTSRGRFSRQACMPTSSSYGPIKRAASPRGPARHGGQRNRIGLSSGSRIQLAAPIKVRPVVVLDRRAAHSAKEKLAAVRAQLTIAGLAADLDVRHVNLVGRLDPIP